MVGGSSTTLIVSLKSTLFFYEPQYFSFGLRAKAEKLNSCWPTSLPPSKRTIAICVQTANKRRRKPTDRTCGGKKARTKDDSSCSMRPSQPLDKVRYLMDIAAKRNALTASISTGPKRSDNAAFGNRKE